MSETTPFWLEVHAFGSSHKGEGIILRLPDGQYGAVDCCFRGDIANPNQNPMVAFLKEKKVKKLAFICLTHPHDDHYFGLSQLMDAAPPDEFWTPAAMHPESLRNIILAEWSDAVRQGDIKASRQLKELEQIYKTWKNLKRQTKANRQTKRAGGGTRLYPNQMPRSPDFTIEAFSPSGHEIEGYEESLKHCFHDGRPKNKFPSLKHNRISVGLLVESDQFAVVLGGDVEQVNWKKAIDGVASDRWKAVRLIKVSHHGSTTGNSSELWDFIRTSNRSMNAVVTGYKSSGLPEAVVLTDLLEIADHVYCTNVASLPDGFQVDRRLEVSPESITAISEFFYDDRQADLSHGFDDVQPEGELTYGSCSFYFKKDGSMFVETRGAACEVPLRAEPLA